MFSFARCIARILKNYIQNGWLTGNELRQVVRAYRMLQKGDDINELKNYFDEFNKTAGV